MRFKFNYIILAALFSFHPGCLSAQETDDEILREALWTRLALARPPARPSVGLALSGEANRLASEPSRQHVDFLKISNCFNIFKPLRVWPVVGQDLAAKRIDLDLENNRTQTGSFQP